MPTVGISIARLRKLLRADVDDARLEQLLDQLGCDVEGITTVRRYISKHSDYAIELTPSESLPLTDPGSGVSADKAEDVWQLAARSRSFARAAAGAPCIFVRVGWRARCVAT